MNDPRRQLTALPVADLVLLLQHSGSRTASFALIERQLTAGLSLNPDGTINFFVYLAYLLRRTS